MYILNIASEEVCENILNSQFPTERKRVVTNHFRIITYFRPDDRLRARGGHFGHAKKKNLGFFFLRGAAVVSRPNILLLRLARRFPKFATVITPS